MADYLEQVQEVIPEISVSGVFQFVTWFVIFIVLAVIAAAATYFFVIRLKFNKKIVVFEKINGRFEPAGRDLAMDFKVGMGGDTVFFLRKRKKYISTPRIQTGRRTYWFAIREDGEWLNIGIEDIDLKSRQMKLELTDESMKHTRVALQRSLRDRYNKVTFLEKYGGMIAYSTLILITGIAIWLVADKMVLIVERVASQIEIANQLAIKQQEILGALDNICSTSGLKPA